MASLAAVERLVRRMLAPVHRRARLMIARAVLGKVADDDEAMQRVQVDIFEGQTLDEIENFQPYGLSARPSKDSECVAIAIGGNHDHVIVLGVNDRSVRPTGLAEGETCIYDKSGSKVVLKSNGDIQVIPSGSGVVHVGAESAAAWIARADAVDNRLDTIETWVASAVQAHNDHVHDDAEGRPTDPVSLTETPPHHFTAMPALATVAATKGKVT